MGFLGGVSNRSNLRVHFAHRHVQDKILILEEGNRPHPRYPKCNMFVLHKALNGQHLATDICRRGEERKWRRLTEYEARSVAETAITAYGITLDPVSSLNYLGRVMLALENNWTVVVCNLRRAQQKWGRLTRVL